jgi:hypothetical protein
MSGSPFSDYFPASKGDAMHARRLPTIESDWLSDVPGQTGEASLERHFSVSDLASLWALSEQTIRRMFAGEPGVIEWGHTESRFKRGYITMRIPESVVQRVHCRLRSS